MWASLSSNDNSGVVGAIGLIVSVIGFAFTLYQLFLTRRAAEAAKIASESTTARFNTFNALRECENARQILKTIADKMAATQWNEALLSYHPLSVSLEVLRQSNLGFDHEVVSGLGAAIDRIEQNSDILEKNLATTPQKITIGKQLASLRPIETAVTRAYFNVERIG